MDVDGKVEATRVGVAISGATIYGMTLNEWVAAATMAYLAIQMIVLMPKALESISLLARKVRGGNDDTK